MVDILPLKKQDFRKRCVPRPLINIYNYDGCTTFNQYNQWCREILAKKWDHEMWIQLKTVLDNITNKEFFDFGAVSRNEINYIYKILNKEYWGIPNQHAE